MNDSSVFVSAYFSEYNFNAKTILEPGDFSYKKKGSDGTL